MYGNTIELGRQPASPVLSKPGLAIALPNNPFRRTGGPRPMLYGCLREPKATAPPQRRKLLDGLFLTAVEIQDQSPSSRNLFERKAVFDDDIQDFGTDWGAWFHLDLQEWLQIAAPTYAFMLHASSRQFVSNVIYVRFEA